MTFKIELDREHDGRWIAEIPDLAGVLCYGSSESEAVAKIQALALRVLAERLEHQEGPSELVSKRTVGMADRAPGRRRNPNG